jgi:hypothetical protein
MSENLSEFIPLKEASELTSLSVGAIRQAIRRGSIESLVHLSLVHVHKEGVQEYAKKSRTKSTPIRTEKGVHLSEKKIEELLEKYTAGLRESLELEIEKARTEFKESLEKLEEEKEDLRKAFIKNLASATHPDVSSLPAPSKPRRRWLLFGRKENN